MRKVGGDGGVVWVIFLGLGEPMGRGEGIERTRWVSIAGLQH